MKKIALMLLSCSLVDFAIAQTPETIEPPKVYKNVIGIDATGLITQLFNFNSNGPSVFSYPYMISYRRIFNANAFRVGIGGNYYTSNATTNDTIQDHSKRTDFNAGIGLEHYSSLGQRWSFYFGGDLILNMRNYDNTRTISTSQQFKATSTGFGISPLLGIQFKINSRLSLATETSYSISYVMQTTSIIETPSTGYNRDTRSTGIETGFNAPIALNFRIHF